jgi:hypothetical protein
MQIFARLDLELFALPWKIDSLPAKSSGGGKSFFTSPSNLFDMQSVKNL